MVILLSPYYYNAVEHTFYGSPSNSEVHAQTEEVIKV